MGVLDGRRILFIGDSLSVSGFGPRLEALLADAGATVTRDAKGGRSVRWFYANSGLDSGRLWDLVKEADPTDVVIALGTNDAGFGPDDCMKWWTRFMGEIRQWSSQPPRFYWVTPPAFEARAGSVGSNVESIREPLAQLFDGVVDSEPLTEDMLTPAQGRARDFIHFTVPAGEAWADRVAPELLGMMSTGTQSGSSGSGSSSASSASSTSGALLVGAAIVLGLLLFRLAASGDPPILKESES